MVNKKSNGGCVKDKLGQRKVNTALPPWDKTREREVESERRGRKREKEGKRERGKGTFKQPAIITDTIICIIFVSGEASVSTAG